MINNFFQLVKDVLFPVFCVECGVEGEWWCSDCRGKYDLSPVFLCPVCKQKNINGAVCTGCAGQSFLDGAVAWFHYDEDSPPGQLIKKLKYNYVLDVRNVLTEIFADTAQKIDLERFSDFVIVPVPLWPRRERERGFNQAEVIAKIIGDFGNNEINNNLKRVRATAQQARLSREERQKNVAMAFVWRGAGVIPSKILLVDDVFTTGATMQECARALKQNGAQTVWGMSAARG